MFSQASPEAAGNRVPKLPKQPEPTDLGKGALAVAIRPSKGDNTKRRVTALDDRELSDWLIDLMADSSGEFLCALAEAVVAASAEDYIIVRPALVDLKRKYEAKKCKRK
jgi:hypothetical protein